MKDIPPKYYFRLHNRNLCTDLLAKLKIGESVTIPRKFYTSVHRSARFLKIKITTRTMGDPENFTAWRIE